MIKLIALLSSIFINLYAGIILLGTSNKQFRNRLYLSLFFFNSFILFIGHFLSFNKYWEAFKFYDFLFLASLLAFYPLYYLYLYSAFNFSFTKTKWIVHFIPSILIGLTMLFVSSIAKWEQYQEYMNNNLYDTPLSNTTSKILAFLYKGSRGFHLVQIIAYNFLAIRFILKVKKDMSNLFSNLDKYQLKYFYVANISFIILMSVPGFYVTVIGRSPLNTQDFLLLFMCLLFTSLYVILAVIGIKQIPAEVNISENEHLKNNIETVAEPENDLEIVHKDLIDYFSTNKPWESPNLNIWDVAKKIGSNRSYVSRVINEEVGCNFNQFVNNYRIDQAKQLLTKDSDMPISEVSELSGFGSVNSFIRIFKSLENCTPTQFRNKN